MIVVPNLDAFGNELVKAGEESAEHADHFVGWQTRRQPREPDDIRKEHRDGRILVGDRPLAGEEARGDRNRKDVEQQRVCPVLLELQRLCLLGNDDVLIEDAAA